MAIPGSYTSAPSDLALQNRLLAKFRFRQMQVLLALAQQGSIRRAAEAIGMTQPGVTKVLSELERVVGTRLFQRHALGVRPTDDCVELLQLARRTVDGAMATAVALAARHRHGQGCVRVMGLTAAIGGLVPDLLAFNAAHPRTQLQIEDARQDDLLLHAVRGDVDLALCRAPRQVPAGWRCDLLREDEFVVVAAPGHRLARRRRLSLAELDGETWLPANPTARARTALDALARESGQPLALSEVVTSLPGLTLALLLQGQVIGLVPRSLFRRQLEAGEIVMLRLDKRLPLEPIAMLTPVEQVSPATRRLAEFLLANAGTPGLARPDAPVRPRASRPGT